MRHYAAGLREQGYAVDCPLNFLYWNFLLEHEAALRAHPRLGRSVLGLRHLNDGERLAVCHQAQASLDWPDYSEA